MWAYLLRRILLVVPTLLGIMVISFVIVQAAPGGPIDQTLAQIRGASGGSLPPRYRVQKRRFSATVSDGFSASRWPT